MGHWYLVRHGETDWNLTERIQGQVDVPLNSTGIRQVSHLARRLEDVRIDAIYSSDLARTHETARLIAAGRDTAIVTDPALREFSFGEWEGLTSEEIEALQPGAMAERISAGNEEFSAPGGENTWQVLDRVRQFCARAAERHDPSDDVLIVAHGGSIRALAVALLDLAATEFWRFRIHCASLAIIRNHSDGRTLVRWNDISHLPAEDRDTPI
ncbi:MAG: histidine phosphatase family protein [Chloroflexi bacterium]|nr:histidine phosphatase family protein [Chloroflexota bacterium]